MRSPGGSGAEEGEIKLMGASIHVTPPLLSSLCLDSMETWESHSPLLFVLKWAQQHPHPVSLGRLVAEEKSACPRQGCSNGGVMCLGHQ